VKLKLFRDETLEFGTVPKNSGCLVTLSLYLKKESSLHLRKWCIVNTWETGLYVYTGETGVIYTRKWKWLVVESLIVAVNVNLSHYHAIMTAAVYRCAYPFRKILNMSKFTGFRHVSLTHCIVIPLFAYVTHMHIIQIEGYIENKRYLLSREKCEEFVTWLVSAMCQTSLYSWGIRTEHYELHISSFKFIQWIHYFTQFHSMNTSRFIQVHSMHTSISSSSFNVYGHFIQKLEWTVRYTVYLTVHSSSLKRIHRFIQVHSMNIWVQLSTGMYFPWPLKSQNTTIFPNNN